MANNTRKIEILIDEDWVTVPMKEVKAGNTFRMTEPDEAEPFGSWIATCDATFTYEGPNGETVWGVNADDPEEIE